MHCFCPAGIGVQVEPLVRDRSTKKLRWGKKFIHRVVLLGFYADSPARVKLLNCAAMNAYLGCFYCWMNGSWLHGFMRWAEYSEAVRLEKGLMVGQTAQVGVDDHQVKISNKDQRARGRAVQDGLVKFETAGVHGVCIIAQLLPYVDINRLFLVPINHALHRGVLRDLLLELLQSPVQLGKAREEHAAKARPRNLVMAERAVAERTAARVSGIWMWDVTCSAVLVGPLGWS